MQTQRAATSSVLAHLALALCAGFLAAGCDRPAPAQRASAAAPQKVQAARPSKAQAAGKSPAAAPPTARQPVLAEHTPPAPASPPIRIDDRRRSAPLADLVAEAAAREFDLPAIDQRRSAAAGIRKLSGRHVELYTDLPAGEVDELPAVFDAAVPLWCDYFGIERASAAEWKIVGHVMQSKERFLGAGLYDESLPDFPHGFSKGSQLWLYDQPSAYYRRHLLVHEGTHCFMYRWLGGAGPPWYMEGMAELLGTHRWEAGRLTLAVMPDRKEDFPYWGRVKIVQDEYAAGRGLLLEAVMRFTNQAHLKTEPYGWSWAAAAFLDAHPLTQGEFRGLKSQVSDRSGDFSERFQDRLRPHWRAISEDWQVFVAECDYGYDFARAAIVRKDAEPLPAGGATFPLDTARGWQSTGFRLEGGKSYTISASGRFQVAGGERPWPCEAGGVTIRYHNGMPLGMLMGLVCDDERHNVAAALAGRQTIGLASVLTPTESGVLYLSINEAASGLADNRGTLEVAIREK